MATREADIVYEDRDYWIGKTRGSFTVYVTGEVASYPLATFEEPGLATAYCKHLQNTHTPDVHRGRLKCGEKIAAGS